MKKAELNEILKLKKEVKQLSQKLQELNYGDDETVVSDKVRGSMSEYPYSARSFNLVGREQMSEGCIQKRSEIGKKISDKYYELNCRINKAYDYILGIDDSEIRQILQYKYIDGLNSEEIGEILGWTSRTIERRLENWYKSCR